MQRTTCVPQATESVLLPHRTSMNVEPALSRGAAKPVGAEGLWENIFSIRFSQSCGLLKSWSTTEEDPEGVGDNEAKLFNPSKNTKGPNLTQRKVLMKSKVIMKTQGYVLPSTTPTRLPRKESRPRSLLPKESNCKMSNPRTSSDVWAPKGIGIISRHPCHYYTWVFLGHGSQWPMRQLVARLPQSGASRTWNNRSLDPNELKVLTWSKRTMTILNHLCEFTQPLIMIRGNIVS